MFSLAAAAVQCTGLVWRRLRADAQTLACPQLGEFNGVGFRGVFFRILLLHSRPQYTASAAVVQCTGLVWRQRLADADISMPTNWEFHGAELRGLFEKLAFTLKATVYLLQEVCEYSPNISFWCKPAI